jgi:hypothetical protein
MAERPDGGGADSRDETTRGTGAARRALQVLLAFAAGFLIILLGQALLPAIGGAGAGLGERLGAAAAWWRGWKESTLSALLTTPFLLPVVLSLLAAAVLAFGLPRASRFRQPDRARGGLVAVAAGLVALWLLPACVLVVGGGELQGILFILALVVAAGVLGGGLEWLRRANNTPRDDYYDDLLG